MDGLAILSISSIKTTPSCSTDLDRQRVLPNIAAVDAVDAYLPCSQPAGPSPSGFIEAAGRNYFEDPFWTVTTKNFGMV